MDAGIWIAETVTNPRNTVSECGTIAYRIIRLSKRREQGAGNE